jgi:diguanylate cyclase (GGDEF)-like protein/PAS domain S-box-containing protein
MKAPQTPQTLLARLRAGVAGRGGGVTVGILVFALILIGGLWAMILTEEQEERDEIIATAVKQNSNLAVAYEEHVARTLKGLDGVLLFLRHEYQRVGTRMDIGQYIRDGIIDERLFSIVSLTDERGNVVVSSKPVAQINYSDREYFRTHQLRRGRDDLYISTPLLGRISDTWQVPISRPLIKTDGSFGGVVMLSVNPDYFTRFYQKAEIGKQGLVMLVGLDGISRARRVGNTLSFGDDMADTALLQEQARSDTGEILSQKGVDNVTRYVSYRTLPGYPLIVAVGASRDEVLAEFFRNRNRDYFLAMLITASIMGFAAMLVVAVHRQERSAIALATSEARFRATFEQAAIGIAHTSLDGRYLAVNRKFCDMLGYTREELVGSPSTSVTHPEDQDNEGLFRERLMSGIPSLTAEKRYVCKDGRVIWGNRTVSLVTDHAGEPLYFLRVVEDITERKRLQAELLEMATTDALTGLPNRRTFMTRLEEEFARVKRFNTHQVAVLMLDLDYFKRINDTHGHAAGDEVLRQVAMLIRDETRRVDLCSRLGGEEFAILLAGAALNAASDFAERLRGKIAAAAIIHDGKAISVTASIGIAAMKASDDAADAALLRADGALYHAKDFGRNQVKVAEDGEVAAAGISAA